MQQQDLLEENKTVTARGRLSAWCGRVWDARCNKLKEWYTHLSDGLDQRTKYETLILGIIQAAVLLLVSMILAATVGMPYDSEGLFILDLSVYGFIFLVLFLMIAMIENACSAQASAFPPLFVFNMAMATLGWQLLVWLCVLLGLVAYACVGIAVDVHLLTVYFYVGLLILPCIGITVILIGLLLMIVEEVKGCCRGDRTIPQPHSQPVGAVETNHVEGVVKKEDYVPSTADVVV